jgi:Uma2 family endonuclease
MVGFALVPPEDRDAHDDIVVLHNLSWGDFQRLLEARGDRAFPRMTYLEGDLELMNPSRSHETLKSRIGCLVEVYCQVEGIEFDPVGSWLLEEKEAERGVEPDECYIFGELDRDRPHLAIEVVWTSGGLNKLEVYRKLRVPEVWYWIRGKISIHALRGERYEPIANSEVLPGIDLDLLASFLDRRTSQAMREYRRALESRRPSTPRP